MNKISKLMMVIALGTSVTAMAETISFGRISLKSGYVSHVGKIEISATQGGMLKVLHDKNICTADGQGCTKMAFFPETVEAKVMEDRRSEGGELVLELTRDINLIVSPENNRDGLVHYTAHVKSAVGTESTTSVQIPLNISVGLTVAK